MQWRRRVDEAKYQILFALSMILTNVAYYFIPLVSVMFAGHLGELELTSSKFANSWGAVSGFAFMVKSLQILSILSTLITGLAFANCVFSISIEIEGTNVPLRVLVGFTEDTTTHALETTTPTFLSQLQRLLPTNHCHFH
ncbi:Uncharacterized protein Fot_05128 [Forsythia ovata]|uniref:Uncharacterized protein n=1 Tax=Forsythia ovata TaxID=205694 RepID=A0ABD1WPB4_9LAMI